MNRGSKSRQTGHRPFLGEPEGRPQDVSLMIVENLEQGPQGPSEPINPKLSSVGDADDPVVGQSRDFSRSLRLHLVNNGDIKPVGRCPVPCD